MDGDGKDSGGARCEIGKDELLFNFREPCLASCSSDRTFFSGCSAL